MLNLTDKDFEKTIQEANKPVLVDFFAFWCHGCQILSPILEKLAEEYQEKAVFAKANVDEVPLAAQKFGIEQIPTVILFKAGQPAAGFIGAVPESEVKKWLETNFKKEEEEMEQIIKEYESYAAENNFKLNPNREAVKEIIKGLLANEKKYGQRYCPCRRITGNAEEDAKKICPCAWHKDEVAKQGHCLCNLFVK